MQLSKPFFRLPCLFDTERLVKEVGALPSSAWVPHPNGIAGNSSVRLISVDGGENDLVEGRMLPTAHLELTPYIRQILSSFGVAWSRTRLLRLAPSAAVPAHADINYHWFYRVRMHFPILTRPEVLFSCDGASVHMAAGECWLFDNWRLHNVVNPSEHERIHLVADTAGNSAFWRLVASGEDPATMVGQLEYRSLKQAPLMTERGTMRAVMNPAELDLLLGNLRTELIAVSDTIDARIQLARYHGLLDVFVKDWRQAYLLFGEDERGWPEFETLRDSLREASRPLAEGLAMRTNRVAAHQVLEARVLRACFYVPRSSAAARTSNTVRSQASVKRPVIIIAAPRSGSSLLFETLAASDQIATLGGEAHWLIESIAQLSPGEPGVTSNRLTAQHATAPIIERIRSQVCERMVDRDGHPIVDNEHRWLEKTPKNALRIPFLNRIFPDALFIFLWREPRSSLSSIMSAWKSGKWQTYPRIEGFEWPWSLLLPPGWESLRGMSLEEIAAFQWAVTNEIVLNDLSAMPDERWTIVDYASFVANPANSVKRLCAFAGLEFDTSLRARTNSTLPEARHTLTAPHPDKWQKDATAISRVFEDLEPVWTRLKQVTESRVS